MIGTSLGTTTLPKATSLTDSLTRPSPHLVSPDELDNLRQTFERELRSTAVFGHPNDRIRVDGYHLRNALSGEVGRDGPFKWSPWTARRPIGIQSVRACLADVRLTPLQASHGVITRLLRRADDERGHPGSLAEWLGRLAVGGRAVVQAEAVVWATQLLTALDWTRLNDPIVGADRSVVLTSSSNVLLRGRIEVRTRVAPTRSMAGMGHQVGATPPEVILAMMTGRPGPTARAELGLAALTVGLDDRHGRVPVRVVGWWPQCGRALVVPVDLGLLDHACEAVVDAVRAACPHKRQQPRSARGSTKPDAGRDVSKKLTLRTTKPIIAHAEPVAS